MIAPAHQILHGLMLTRKPKISNNPFNFNALHEFWIPAYVSKSNDPFLADD